MATVKWTVFTDRGNLAGTMMNTKGDTVLMGPSTALDNATNNDTHAILEINFGSYSPITTGDCFIEIYMVKAPDGTNYEEAPVSGGADRNTLIATVPVPPGASSTPRVMTGLITLPPCPVKFYITNQTNATTAGSANTLDVYTANLESA